MKRLYLIYLLLSGLNSSAQMTASSTLEKWVEITMPLYSLKYPDSWTADTSKMFGIDLLLRSPKVDSLDQFGENMNVFIQNLSGKNYDLTKMGRESESQIKNMITEVEILESHLDSTSYPYFYLLKYRGRQGKFVLITHQRYYLKNDVGIALTFTVQNDKEEDYRLTSSNIFKSFRLL